MKLFAGRDQLRAVFASRRTRKVGVVAFLLGVASLLPLLFVAGPYVTLWRMDQAVGKGDMTALTDFVDLEDVRAEIKKKLNKEADSSIGELSDAFIRWLEEGIGEMGNQAVERLVTMAWVKERLLENSGGEVDRGFLGQISYAFFEAPDRFVVRLGAEGNTPVRLQLTRSGLHWRVSAVYY